MLSGYTSDAEERVRGWVHAMSLFMIHEISSWHAEGEAFQGRADLRPGRDTTPLGRVHDRARGPRRPRGPAPPPGRPPRGRPRRSKGRCRRGDERGDAAGGAGGGGPAPGGGGAPKGDP